ncbi:MAG: hypothetical protein ABW184_03840 [Sphingobium sp.]
MTELPHRHQSVTSGANTTDRVSAVRAVTPVATTPSRSDVNSDLPSQRPVLQAEGAAHSGEDAARAHADYAKVHRDIADVVDSLSVTPQGQNPAALADAESALLSLLPQPAVILPLPPADEDMVAFVAQISQSIARQSAQTRAAMSAVAPAVVDAATAA